MTFHKHGCTGIDLDKTLPYSEADETLAYWDDDEQTENTQYEDEERSTQLLMQSDIFLLTPLWPNLFLIWNRDPLLAALFPQTTTLFMVAQALTWMRHFRILKQMKLLPTGMMTNKQKILILKMRMLKIFYLFQEVYSHFTVKCITAL
jgi:hypothetical protein